MTNTTLYLSPGQMGAVYVILVAQITGVFSNILCIIIVSQMSNTKFINRPKILMANIAVSDTLLTINSIVPRLFLIELVYHSCPLAAHVLQSIRQYLDNLTLYATSFAFTLVACDRYFAITRVFNNPFDDYSTRKITAVVWTASVVLSVPYAITSELDFYDWRTSCLTCVHDGLYLTELTSNKTWIIVTRLMAFFIEFIFPTIMVTWFTIQIVIKLCQEYRDSLRGIQLKTNLRKCEVTKRLVTVLVIFVIKNASYYLSIIGFNFDLSKKPGNSCAMTRSYTFVT